MTNPLGVGYSIPALKTVVLSFYMLMIRLQRVGKAKHPTYRVILSEKQRDTQGRYRELLGTYNPTVTPKQLLVNKERILYWIGVGAQLSPTLNNLFIKEKIIDGKKKKSVFLSTKRKAALAKEAEAAAPAPAAPAAA